MPSAHVGGLRGIQPGLPTEAGQRTDGVEDLPRMGDEELPHLPFRWIFRQSALLTMRRTHQDFRRGGEVAVLLLPWTAHVPDERMQAQYRNVLLMAGRIQIQESGVREGDQGLPDLATGRR